jgi:hypothetical protein
MSVGFTAMVDYAAAVVQDRSLATTYRQIHRAFADTVSVVVAIDYIRYGYIMAL